MKLTQVQMKIESINFNKLIHYGFGKMPKLLTDEYYKDNELRKEIEKAMEPCFFIFQPENYCGILKEDNNRQSVIGTLLKLQKSFQTDGNGTISDLDVSDNIVTVVTYPKDIKQYSFYDPKTRIITITKLEGR